jgi:hypothetical protein
VAATVEIRSFHGATPDAGTNVASGSIRFKAADNDTVDANNPLAIPGAGTIYSYVKQLRFYAATTPSNQINNLKFYTDSSNGFGTGVGLTAKTFVMQTGTATSGTTTTLTNTGASFPTAGTGLTGFVLEITGGTNSGSGRRITSNTATVITVGTAFGSAIDATSVYRVWYYDPVNNAQTQIAGMTDAFTMTSGAPLTIAGSISNPSTGAFGDGTYLQMSVASTASQGTTPSETLTWSYDES